MNTTTTRPLTREEKPFYDVMAKHYAERIANEKNNIAAKRVLRPRLINIKGIIATKSISTIAI